MRFDKAKEFLLNLGNSLGCLGGITRSSGQRNPEIFREVSEGAYKIVSWDVFNLCGVPPVCTQQTSKGACNRLAKYQKGNIKCCKSCAKKTDFTIPSETLLKATQSRTKVCELKNIAQEYGIDIPKSAKKTLNNEIFICVL